MKQPSIQSFKRLTDLQRSTMDICKFLVASLFLIFLSSCSKDPIRQQQPTITSNASINSNTNTVTLYTGLDKETVWQLQQARAATARYRELRNALKDGYADINVIIPNMGYHFMKAGYLDGTFDPRKPEILVYNKDANGNWILTATEYAVPIALSPNSAPEGFVGDQDVWDYDTTFGLWLCHAWVWSYNPNGVFSQLNPMIHVQ